MNLIDIDHAFLLLGICIGMSFSTLMYVAILKRVKADSHQDGLLCGRAATMKATREQAHRMFDEITRLRTKCLQHEIATADQKAIQDKYQSTIDGLRQTMASAYGWLWHAHGERFAHKGRQILLQALDKDLQTFGIQAAKDAGAAPPDGVIITEDGAFHIKEGSEA